MKHSFLLALTLLAILSTPSAADDRVEFARDVLPILSANCFPCHGPDEGDRQADLRLDGAAHLAQKRKAGVLVSAGQPDESLIWSRITSTDPELVMPPPSSNKQLKPTQIELIQRWIVQGGQWQNHWAFEPIIRPMGTLDDQVRNALASKGLGLSPKASPERLVRRLSLDLLGLPPSDKEVEAFAKQPTRSEWEKLVDRYLSRPEFGEHWARMWLDLARYADTKGYEKDLGRTMWPWRDWVVDALNDDMPLDQFTSRQLAGDLLPNVGLAERIATAFHRNTMSNDEGGTDDEEFRVVAVKDRVDTTVQVWMGLTMGCAKCHSHKYDPISINDYYRLYAIFNQTEDADRYDDNPRLDLPTETQKLRIAALATETAELQESLLVARRDAEEADGIKNAAWKGLSELSAKSDKGATLKLADDGAIEVSGERLIDDVYVVEGKLPAGTHTALRIEALPTKLSDGKSGLGRNPADPNFVLSELKVEFLDGESLILAKLINPRADFSQEGWAVAKAIDGDPATGWAVSPKSRERHVAMFDFETPQKLESATKVRVTLTQKYGNSLLLARFRVQFSDRPTSELALLTPSPEIQAQQQKLADLQKQQQQLTAEIPQLPIMKELPGDKRRTTKVHRRGNFMDPGDAVEPGIPSRFGPTPDSVTPTRLDVANWLVHPNNPLTPRVWANRIWARLHGVGIVETEEDFGALGAWPTNQPLLDWLAAEYRDRRWSLKALLRTIVLSDAYQQSSATTDKQHEIDPQNRLISRGSRFRLSAEVVRDQALAVGGLLSLKKKGPSVMPPQPAGLWRSTYNGKSWIDADGEDRYRRGIYTYLKRTTPYPSFIIFDGGSGEVCQVRRIRTNTPLQALVTLNDPVYLEAAGGLARRMLATGTDPLERARYGLAAALHRPIETEELAPLIKLQQLAAARLKANPEKAQQLAEGARFQLTNHEPAEAASWIVVASSILNLDEFLSRN